jgi:hypothetical protein
MEWVHSIQECGELMKNEWVKDWNYDFYYIAMQIYILVFTNIYSYVSIFHV